LFFFQKYMFVATIVVWVARIENNDEYNV